MSRGECGGVGGWGWVYIEFILNKTTTEASLGTFNAGFVWREDPGVSTGRSADVEVELDVVL